MKSFISFIKNRKIKRVLIRPHPKDDISSFKNMIKKILRYKEFSESNLVISKSKNISEDIGSSNSIFGMNSFGLFIA